MRHIYKIYYNPNGEITTLTTQLSDGDYIEVEQTVYEKVGINPFKYIVRERKLQDKKKKITKPPRLGFADSWDSKVNKQFLVEKNNLFICYKSVNMQTYKEYLEVSEKYSWVKYDS